MKKPYVSFVIPARDEQKSIEILYGEVVEVMKSLKKDFEIIFIDDGSLDATFEIVKRIRKRNKRIKAISLRGNFGKSVALQVGFNVAKADIIITLDSDLQDNPADIPRFLEKLDTGFDLVSGWKKRRRDPFITKVIPSRIINFLARLFTGIPIHDTNCGFKAYKRGVVENLNLYGELYRFIPILAAKENFKIAEIPVHHRARRYGKTKFDWRRGVKGILDLLTIVFLTGYVRRPGHFFGTIGLISFLAGFLIGIYISYLRLTTGSIQYRHPLLFLGMLLMIIGIQLISTGLLAEMIIYSQKKFDYSSLVKESTYDILRGLKSAASPPKRG